jgi:hypothetical protein
MRTPKVSLRDGLFGCATSIPCELDLAAAADGVVAELNLLRIGERPRPTPCDPFTVAVIWRRR